MVTVAVPMSECVEDGPDYAVGSSGGVPGDFCDQSPVAFNPSFCISADFGPIARKPLILPAVLSYEGTVSQTWIENTWDPGCNQHGCCRPPPPCAGRRPRGAPPGRVHAGPHEPSASNKVSCQHQAHTAPSMREMTWARYTECRVAAPPTLVAHRIQTFAGPPSLMMATPPSGLGLALCRASTRLGGCCGALARVLGAWYRGRHSEQVA